MAPNRDRAAKKNHRAKARAGLMDRREEVRHPLAGTLLECLPMRTFSISMVNIPYPL